MIRGKKKKNELKKRIQEEKDNVVPEKENEKGKKYWFAEERECAK